MLLKWQRKYFEISMPEDSEFFEEALQKLPEGITHTIPITEFGVRIYERVLRHLGLPNKVSSYIEKCCNKSLMKQHALKNNILIAKYLDIEIWDAEKIFTTLGSDIVIKQLASSGSRGQYFMNNKEDILKNFDHNILV